MDIGSLGIGAVVSLTLIIQYAWYVAVLVLLVKIWKKVRHLPG